MNKIILIVDDQAEIRRLITLTLDYGVYELHEACDGTSALRLSSALKPDLVLLDVMMPGEFDGYQVCTQIKNSAAPPAVVLLTARGQLVDRANGEQAGCDAYLTKPFSPLQLIEITERLLG